MFNKRRLPFLLLGIGIGIILTNIIYSFNPKVEYREMSEVEISEKARELGMVSIKDNIEMSTEKEIKETEEPDDVEEEVDEYQLEVENKTIKSKIVIKSGDTLEKVSKDLHDLGLISDLEDFKKYAKFKGVDKKLRVGTYEISSEDNYETISNILTKTLK